MKAPENQCGCEGRPALCMEVELPPEDLAAMTWCETVGDVDLAVAQLHEAFFYAARKANQHNRAGQKPRIKVVLEWS